MAPEGLKFRSQTQPLLPVTIHISLGHHHISLRFILILSSNLSLGFPGGFFLSCLPIKSRYALYLYPIFAKCIAHLILLGLITPIIFGEEYKSRCT